MIRTSTATADSNDNVARVPGVGAGCFRFDRGTDLKRRVVNFLTTRNRPALRHIEVEVENDVVVLKGRVASFYDKQLASHCCSRVAGVVRVVDGLFVVPDSTTLPS